MPYGLFDTLDWLTKRVKRLCCSVDTIKATKNNFVNVPTYADNAAALTGGLLTGDIYRTGDLLKIVH